MYFFDTETIGFKGPMILLQYAIDNDDIILHNCWTEPVKKTLTIIEDMCQDTICGFNLTFDWFHISKLYNMIRHLPKNHCPIAYIKELANIESASRESARCLRPTHAIDLMCVARNGIYQNTMNRKPIRIKRVPTVLVYKLKDELERCVQIPGLYFAKRAKSSNERWDIKDVENDLGIIDPNFKDIVLTFAPSTALKALAVDALHHENVITHDIMDDGSGDLQSLIKEDDYIPYGGNWPYIIDMFIDRWEYNEIARQYAEDDVTYTRELYNYFGNPKPDRDSELACMVGTTRWRGFAINKVRIKRLLAVAQRDAGLAPHAPAKVKEFLSEVMSETERIVLNSTSKDILEKIIEWDSGNHPAAKRAKAVLEARQAMYDISNYEKLLACGRFHADFTIVGTKSNRMAGTGGLNPQGIRKKYRIRKAFNLAEDNEKLWGGDFDAFEPAIAATVYYDQDLMELLKTGKKFHAVFGESLYPEMSYDDIMNGSHDRGTAYYNSKTGSLATTYMAQAFTLDKRIPGIGMERAQNAIDNYKQRFPGVERAQRAIAEKFTALQQRGGLGSEVEWKDPDEYIESILGFRRYFTLENEIIKQLYSLASDLPRDWRDLKIKVRRRDRDQTAAGAVSSALYAAAFTLMQANIRAAANHVVQSVGAEITKELQWLLWTTFQPVGVNKFHIKLLNIHDEILAPMIPDIQQQVKEVQQQFIAKMKEIIELLKMDWKELKSWAG